MWFKYMYVSNNVGYGETLRLLVSAFTTVAWKSFNGKFTVKIDFPIFGGLPTDNDIGSPKSLHTLFDKGVFRNNLMWGGGGLGKMRVQFQLFYYGRTNSFRK